MRKTSLLKEIPFISVKQMIEVDRLMIEGYGIHLIQMMENAGRNIAGFINSNIALRSTVTRVLVMVGSGGNGGGVMVAARHLSNKGFDVDVVISTSVASLKGVIKHQADILTKLPVRILEKELPVKKYDLIIDGIIGYSLNGEPRGFAQEMMEFCNASKSKVVSLDTPSGLSLDNIRANNPIVKADFTITLALPKIGLKSEEAEGFVGRLFLSDISVPPSLYLQMGLDVSDKIFEDGYLVEL